MRADGAIVVLSPPPTPNGPLHLGHLAGPYVAADVAVRALRNRGEQVVSVCGLDDHQNYVRARAVQENIEASSSRDHYAKLIRHVFDRIGIVHDEFTEPLHDHGYRRAVARFLDDLAGSGACPVESWTTPVCPVCPGTLHHAYVSGRCPCGAGSNGGTCEACGSYTPASALAEPVCTRCGRAATASSTVTGPVLRIEDHRDALQAFWCRAVLPGGVRHLIARLLAEPLPTVPLAYPTDWGIEHAGTRIDVWAEMGLGYLYTIGHRFAPGADTLAEHVRGWQQEVRELWTFLGLDNAFYYAVMFPALFAAAGLPLDSLAGLVVNEFYRLAGRKFSTSREHAVWAHEFLAVEEPSDVRLFLSWDRPAPHATNFTQERFATAVKAWRTPKGTGATSTADLERAEEALLPATFDSALATRCLLAADPANPAAALGAITGGDFRTSSPAPDYRLP